MRLGIISDCVHYRHADGRVGTENHIFLRQMETLASYFPATTMACGFSTLNESKVITWYKGNIDFIELPDVGGKTLKAKLQIISVIPKWFSAFRKIDKATDIIYQRFPNNVNIPGFFYFFLKRKKVFATFTGTWLTYRGEPFTYIFQRWLLRHFFRGPVWAYTTVAECNGRIKPGYSPSYNLTDWNEETAQVTARIEHLRQTGLDVFRLITVGKLIDYKNQLYILKACVILKDRHFPFTLKIVGDGPMQNELKTYIDQNNLSNEVELTGKKTDKELRTLYRQSDFVVQAPLKEGFGKVPIEGFFHGAVPVLNNLSMAGYMTGNNERGFLFEASEAENLAKKLMEIKNNTTWLPAMIQRGRAFAKTQTLESWAKEYYEIATEFCKEV